MGGVRATIAWFSKLPWANEHLR